MSLPSFFPPRRFLLCTAVILLPWWPAATARAGSFAINEQSVSGLGAAYAGGAAQGADASSLFFNPATLTLLDGGQAQFGGQYVIPTAQFHNDGSRLRAPGTPFDGESLRGIESGDGAKDKLLPNFYVSQAVFRHQPFGDLTLGFGLSVPFGLETDYDPTWVGRYAALRTKLTTLDLQPSIAYRLFDRLSLGASLDVQYASARLSQAVDFGAIGASVLGTSFFPRLPAFVRGAVQRAYAGAGFVPQGRDGVTELDGDDWSLGFTVGAVLEYLKPDAGSVFQDGRIGVSYRSGITHNLDGEADFRGVPALAAPGSPVAFPNPGALQGAFRAGAATARLELPEIYHFSIYQRFLRQFAVLGDIEWTRWSRLQDIPITFANPGTPANVLNLRYKDATRYALGFEWYVAKPLTLRLGFAYDESPIRDAETRTPRIPDNNRYFLSGGLRYQPLPCLAFDVGYAHLFMNDPTVNITDAQGHNLIGHFDASVDIVSASVTFLWGGPKPASSVPDEGKALRK